MRSRVSEPILLIVTLGLITTRYNYNSYYFGFGSTGGLTDRLLYGVEAVYEGGTSLSNSFDSLVATLYEVSRLSVASSSSRVAGKYANSIPAVMRNGWVYVKAIWTSLGMTGAKMKRRKTFSHVENNAPGDAGSRPGRSRSRMRRTERARKRCRTRSAASGSHRCSRVFPSDGRHQAPSASDGTG